MKTLPAGMQTDLDSGATKHCYCWKIVRSDGVAMGFTDHDRDLAFDSTTFVAETGLSPSAVEQSSGLNVDSMDVVGVLDAMSLDERDLSAGLYDAAEVTAYRIDWTDVTKRIILLKGSTGEISRGRVGFTAEIRGLAHYLNQPTGRLYSPLCDADVGDSRCGVNLNGTSPGGHAYKVSTTVTLLGNRRNFRADQAVIQAVPADWFTRGLLTWTGGDNSGLRMEIKIHLTQGSQEIFELWEPMPFDIQVGDAFTAQVGCDKTIETCKAKFDNVINHRGAPRIPGNDIILRPAKKSDDNSGGSVF